MSDCEDCQNKKSDGVDATPAKNPKMAAYDRRSLHDRRNILRSKDSRHRTT